MKIDATEVIDIRETGLCTDGTYYKGIFRGSLVVGFKPEESEEIRWDYYERSHKENYLAWF